ncbi:MarR family winged helix-turn-helix transcriptional regulator [Parafrigoribacterium humi]|jgi:DNA-binding MarR family transcriptional regulator|uniref:MarR family winged helix-turn-helix transcriptional regulator n=1 Tax=Parafrigoribacterium humi TaxID=3144664 RepID=UPI0032EF34C2
MSARATAVTAWEALFRAQVSVMRYLGTDFPIDDVTLNEYDVLFTLSRRPDRRLRLRELNRDMLLTQPSVSRLIDRLVARSLVVKLADPDDARGVIVELTDTGFELFRRAAVVHVRSINERVGSALTQDEMETLIQLCEKLRFAEVPAH